MVGVSHVNTARLYVTIFLPFCPLLPQTQRAELLWEQELYIPFKYTASRTYFHTFPADVRDSNAQSTEAALVVHVPLAVTY